MYSWILDDARATVTTENVDTSHFIGELHALRTVHSTSHRHRSGIYPFHGSTMSYCVKRLCEVKCKTRTYGFVDGMEHGNAYHHSRFHLL